MRKYNNELINTLMNNVRVEKVNGVNIVFKPIPDDNRQNILDQRILETAKRKKVLLKPTGRYSLYNERHRADKISYDLTTSEVTREERIIHINDHYIDTFIYTPENHKKSSAVMLFLHGGGFTAGEVGLYHNQMKYIAEQSGSIIVFPEYRLAPENPYPAAIDDCYGILRWIYENAEELNICRDKIVVAGDSAGGSLTNACIIKDKDKVIKLAVELYPGCDSSYDNSLYEWSYELYPVIKEHEEYAYSRIDRIKNGGDVLNKYYIQGKTTAKNPLISVNRLDNFSGFPKMVIVASEYDYLRVGSDYFVKRLIESNVDTTSIRYLGCDHGFLDFLGIEPQAEDFCLEVAKLLREL